MLRNRLRRTVLLAALASGGCASPSYPPSPPAPTAPAASAAPTTTAARPDPQPEATLPKPQRDAASPASTASPQPPATAASAHTATADCPRRNLRTKRDSWLSAGGHTVFDGYCGSCHPNADAGDGPRLDGLRWSRACMRRLIESGHGGRLGSGPIPAPRIDHMMDWLEYARAIE